MKRGLLILALLAGAVAAYALWMKGREPRYDLRLDEPGPEANPEEPYVLTAGPNRHLGVRTPCGYLELAPASAAALRLDRPHRTCRVTVQSGSVQFIGHRLERGQEEVRSFR